MRPVLADAAPTTDGADARLPQSLASYALAVATLLHEPGSVTAYTYETLGTSQDSAPAMALSGAAPGAYTDCSGWVNYALASVAPLHQAVAAAARLGPQFNLGEVAAYVPEGSGLPRRAMIDEASRSWARADVLASFFGQAGAGRNGFSTLADFGQLQAGDLIAYASGIYADPAHPDAAHTPGLVATNDTGHVMIVVGVPVAVPFATLARQGVTSAGVAIADTLDPAVVAIYAVPVVDSSSVPHFRDMTDTATGLPWAPPVSDDRVYGALPQDLAGLPVSIDRKDLQPGGIGTGTLWFGTDATGHAVQFRFGAHDPFFPNESTGPGASATIRISAARLTASIELTGPMLDAEGYLAVNAFPNAAPIVAGTRHDGAEAVHGPGGLRLQGGGVLALQAGNTYAGGTVIESGALHLTGQGAAGTGPIAFATAAAGTILIDPGVTLPNDITGFTDGDTIDLRDLAFTPALTLGFEGGTLKISGQEADATYLRMIQPASEVDGVFQYRLADDGQSGTALTVTHGPGRAAFAYAGPGVLGTGTGEAYDGPVDHLEHAFKTSKPDGMAVTARTANVFIRGSDGADAITVIGGNNVLAGEGGSNFLAGGTGADDGVDTFFIEAQRSEPTWDTIVNFHAGDVVTIWNTEMVDAAWSWRDWQGASGYEGATLRVERGQGGLPNFDLTFAGISLQDKQDHIAFTEGQVGGRAYVAMHWLE